MRPSAILLTGSLFLLACGGATERGVLVDAASASDAGDSVAAEGGIAIDASIAAGDGGADATIPPDAGDSVAAEGGIAIDASMAAGDGGADADSGPVPIDAAIPSDAADSAAAEGGMTSDASMAAQDGGMDADSVAAESGAAIDAPMEAEDDGMGADPAACMISASNYDQSCARDSDCIPMVEGDLCAFFCDCLYTAAINVASERAYNAATAWIISRRPADAGVYGCGCGRQPRPTCLAGRCEL